MSKCEIPFIFKYLLRWVPGLKIDEGGNTPTPAEKPIPFSEGLLLWNLFFNRYGDLDVEKFMDSLDWSKAETEPDSPGQMLSLAIYPSVEKYEAHNTNGAYVIQCARIPKGTVYQDKTFEKDAYMLVPVYYPCWMNDEWAEKIGFMDYHVPGWTPFTSVTEMDLNVNLIPADMEIANLKLADVEPLIAATPFVRQRMYTEEEVQEMGDESKVGFYSANNIYFDYTKTPDLSKLEFTHEMQSKIFVEELITNSNSNTSIFAWKVEKGYSGEGATAEKDCYGLICGEDLTVWMDEEFTRISNIQRGTSLQPGWQNYKLGYFFYDQIHTTGSHFIVEGLNQQDVWIDYISNQPFKSNIRTVEEWKRIMS